MNKNFTKCAICSIVMLLMLTGCSGSTVKESELMGKTFQYEKDGFGGEFIIQLKEDGTFTYSEGMFSSYFGVGNWSIKGKVLHLTDTGMQSRTRDFYFRVINVDQLAFIQEDSDTFTYLHVADGERFQSVEDPYADIIRQ